MHNSVFSYITLPQNTFDVSWNVSGIPRRTNDAIKNWTKNMALSGTVSLLVQSNTKELAAFFDSKSRFSFVVSVQSLLSSGGTGLQELVVKQPFTLSKNTNEITIPFTINGELIAGDIELLLYIVLSEKVVNTKSSLFPTNKGSIIYQTGITLRLEGNQALFPVKAIDFSSSQQLAHDSLFYLDRKYSSLDSNFSTAYTLFFNMSHPLFKLINSDSENDKVSQYLIKLIMNDVYRILVQDALESLQELNLSLLDSAHDFYSLARVYTSIIADLLRQYFPDKDFHYLHDLAKKPYEQRVALDTAIQSYTMGEIKNA